MKELKTIVAALAIGAVVVVGFWIAGLIHANHLSHQDIVVATELSNEGITSFLPPDVTNNNVPVTIESGCVVNFQLVTHGSQVTLDIPWSDHAGESIGKTDVITSAATEKAVIQNLTATIAANPTNQVCK